jgi:hypothetical protein
MYVFIFTKYPIYSTLRTAQELNLAIVDTERITVYPYHMPKIVPIPRYPYSEQGQI